MTPYEFRHTTKEMFNNTYTEIPNEYIGKMPLLTAGQSKVFAVILRRTIGFHKLVDTISVSQIAHETGISRTQCHKNLNHLIELKMVKLVKKGENGQSSIYALEKTEEELNNIDRNFTKYPNEILDKWLKHLTGNQFKVLTVFVRCILGYHKTVDSISISYVAGMTGIDRSNSSKTIKQLIELGCVRVISRGDRQNPTIYTLINITEKLTGINSDNPSILPVTQEDSLWRINERKGGVVEKENGCGNERERGVVKTIQGVVEKENGCGENKTGGVVKTDQGVVEIDPTCGENRTGGVVETGQGVWLKQDTQNKCTNKEERKEEIKEERKVLNKEEKKELPPQESQVIEKNNVHFEIENYFSEVESMKSFNPSQLVKEIYSLCDEKGVPIIKNSVQDGNLLMNNHSAFLYGDMTPRKLLDRVLKHYYILDFYKNYHSEEIEKQYDKLSLQKYVGVPLSIKSAMNGWGANIEAFYEAIKPIRDSIDKAKEREANARKRYEEEEASKKLLEEEHKKLVRSEEKERRDRMRVKLGLPPEIYNENGYRTYQESMSKNDFSETEFTDSEWEMFSANLCRDFDWYMDGHKGLSPETIAFMVDKMDALYPDPPPKVVTEEFDFIAALDNLKSI